mmetsp:Transcript_80162/g.232759  ORF Transcript_80162/g.232759 Transcript_80162/m.232759 type:complete len:226 (-) Transcript_80162:66-743(-)
MAASAADVDTSGAPAAPGARRLRAPPPKGVNRCAAGGAGAAVVVRRRAPPKGESRGVVVGKAAGVREAAGAGSGSRRPRWSSLSAMRNSSRSARIHRSRARRPHKANAAEASAAERANPGAPGKSKSCGACHIVATNARRVPELTHEATTASSCLTTAQSNPPAPRRKARSANNAGNSATAMLLGWASPALCKARAAASARERNRMSATSALHCKPCCSKARIAG